MLRLFFLIFSKPFRTEMRTKYENVRPFPLRFLTWMGLLYTLCIKKYFPGGVQDHSYKPEPFCNIDTFLMIMKMKWKHTSCTKFLRPTETLLFNFAEDVPHKDSLTAGSPFWQFEITLWKRDQSCLHELCYCAITDLSLITESCEKFGMTDTAVLTKISFLWIYE